MKILAIMGSPHGMKGNTGRLLEEVLDGVKQGGEVELVSLSESKVFLCVSCYVCHKTGKCTLKDNFEEIKTKLLACDGFIFASPNYIHNVTAQLKALFDRCACIIHCVALEGKYGAVVETSGSGEDADVLGTWSMSSTSLGLNPLAASVHQWQDAVLSRMRNRFMPKPGNWEKSFAGASGRKSTSRNRMLAGTLSRPE